MSEETNVSSVTAEAPAAPEKTGRRLVEPGKPEKKPLSGGKKAGLIVGIIAAVLALAYAGCCVATWEYSTPAATQQPAYCTPTCRERPHGCSCRCFL